MTNRKNALASSARVGFDYAAHEISAEISAELEAKAKSLTDLGRKETDHVFQLGALLEEVSAHIPDGTFAKWVEARCNITARTARNWRGVYRNLGGYRDRAVELAIGPTVLIQLISAPVEKIEAAFAFAEDRGRIQVADVKAILAGNEVPGEGETDAVDLGGVHGLKAMVEARTRDSRTVLLRNLLGLLKILSGALAEAQTTGKRIKKSRIAPKAEVHAYHGYELLSSLGTGVGPQGDGKSTMKVGLPSASRWKKVEALLWRLRDSSNWAKVDSLETWLETIVIPMLTWATSKEKSPAWPLWPEDQSALLPAVAAPPLDFAEIEDDDDVDPDDETEEAEMFEAEALSDVGDEADAEVGGPVAALLSGTSGQRRGPGRRKLELVRD
ncbi:hypothetical protein J2W92_001844 [Rhizobium leguminosarum]